MSHTETHTQLCDCLRMFDYVCRLLDIEMDHLITFRLESGFPLEFAVIVLVYSTILRMSSCMNCCQSNNPFFALTFDQGHDIINFVCS